ncbi:uncharacterized protein LOC127834925 [Dreissena polymorpha]|uniref:Mab-21-like nucleotidyltransferase domain-containing protein n=1 Tax=Dreissena polymorpha TaxID=45954 RepID=A0A9D4G7M1_DREPO|nr:uncharacterized protein LOC127834925 [Dreissena polymorpha]KAH3812011.1 hypothetical protein DPMN_140432 [Dreissena polymorpha]
MNKEKRDYLEVVSKHLFVVLDIAGASEYVRSIRQHCALVTDVITGISNILESNDVAVYTFGSTSEGTTTPGMNSDRDTMICIQTFPVFENKDDISFDALLQKYDNGEDDFSYLLMLTDDLTPVGFCKLEFFPAGEAHLENPNVVLNLDIDLNGRNVISNSCLVEAMTQDERNGPAATTFKRPGFTDLDYIPSFHCTKWPSAAEEFLTRKRKYGFPSTNMAGDFGAFGIFFVPSGHSESSEKHLQWRLSFSLQERKIMLNLNPTQFKCYILLKMMKEDFVKPVVQGKSLTSYQCKTSIFWSIEKTHPSIWTERNIVACFVKCVHLLKIWIRNGFVPNFFMPPVSIWKGNREVRSMVTAVLDKVLNEPIKYLMELKCDRVGSLLRDAVKPCVLECEGYDNGVDDKRNYFNEAKRDLHLAVHRQHYLFIGETADMAMKILQHTRKDDTLDRCIHSHGRLTESLQDSEKISILTAQSLNTTKLATGYLLPFMYTSYGSQLASKAVLESNVELQDQALDYFRAGQRSEKLSGTVKLATALYAFGKYEECLHILKELEASVGTDLITIGMCGRKESDFTHTILVNEELVNKIIDKKMSSSDVLLNNACTCVVFLPSELPIIPKDLQYEMFRSYFAESDIDPGVDYWFDCVAVDSKVLLYYMLYLVHKKLGNNREKNVAMLFLNALIDDDFNLCHFDTGYNLVGCILRDMGHLGAALSSFWNAWVKRPDHNAAKWHAVITCFMYYRLMADETFTLNQELFDLDNNDDNTCVKNPLNES